jgi:hypothetical protein
VELSKPNVSLRTTLSQARRMWQRETGAYAPGSRDRACAHDFSPLAPLIALRANLIKTTMRGGQRLRLRKRPLTGSLSRSIHIDHLPLFFHPVKQATRGSKSLGFQHLFQGHQFFIQQRQACLEALL